MGLQEIATTPVAGGRVSQLAPPTFPLATPRVYMARAPSAKVTQKVAAMVGFQWTPVTRLLDVLRTWAVKRTVRGGKEQAACVIEKEGG